MMNRDRSSFVWERRCLSLLRIVATGLFMQHGGQKLWGFPAGMPSGPVPPFSLIGFAGLLEVFGGLLVFIGLFTRAVSFILSGEMAVAYFLKHFSAGFWPLLNHGELAVLYCFIFLYLSAAGGGPWSIDRFRRGASSEESGRG